MSAIWRKTTIDWKSTATWTQSISHWLRPYCNSRGVRYLSKLGEQDICWDDSDWLEFTRKILQYDLEHINEKLAEDLSFAKIRVFHGCRPIGVRSYFSGGIRLNDPQDREDEVRRMLSEEPGLASLKPEIESRFAEFGSQKDRDNGRLYLCLDDRSLVEDSGHYLLYGSEWITVLLGSSAHDVLRKRGVPTILTVEIPLQLVHKSTRIDLARVLLQEWTRQKVNRPNWIPMRGFTFCMREDISAEFIVDHYHPKTILDPLYNGIVRQTHPIVCDVCDKL